MAARDIAEAGEYRAMIRRMMDQGPDHRVEIVFQSVGDARPGLRAVVTFEHRRARAAVLSTPEAGRGVGGRNQHCRLLAVALRRQKKKVMKVVAGQTVFRAHPAVFWFVAGEETTGARDIVTILPFGQIRNDMNIEIVDAFAHVFPSFAAVEAADDAAVFEAEVYRAGIVRMDMDVAHMAVVRC